MQPRSQDKDLTVMPVWETSSTAEKKLRAGSTALPILEGLAQFWRHVLSSNAIAQLHTTEISKKRKHEIPNEEETTLEHPSSPACDVFQPVLPSITFHLSCVYCGAEPVAMLTVRNIQPRDHSLEGQLTQDILLHISNLLLLPLCLLQAWSGALPFALGEAKAACTEPWHSSASACRSPSTHQRAEYNWRSKLPPLGPVGSKYIFCPQSHMLMAKGKIPQPTCNFVSIKKAPGTSNPFR